MHEYEDFCKNARFYIDSKLPIISNLANISAYIFYHIEQINWAGFYLYKKGDLYLGPFQGKPACTNILMGKGICGTSALKRETVVVKNVHEFSTHIACDSDSKSEIVIPLITKSGDLYGVLDVDSPVLNRFDKNIQKALENVANLLVDIL